MSFFKSCHDCSKIINSYEYIFCDECLKKHLKCQGCSKRITKEQDLESSGNCMCKGCFIIEKLIYNDRSFEANFISIKIRLEKKILEKYEKLSDSSLELKWQSSADMIQQALMKAYNNSTPHIEQEKFFKLAEEYQEIQSLIQNEITRRRKI